MLFIARSLDDPFFIVLSLLMFHQNKAKALKVMCAKLYEMERSRAAASRSRLRAEQVIVSL